MYVKCHGEFNLRSQFEFQNCTLGGTEMPSEGFSQVQISCVKLQWEMPVQNQKSFLSC